MAQKQLHKCWTPQNLCWQLSDSICSSRRFLNLPVMYFIFIFWFFGGWDSYTKVANQHVHLSLPVAAKVSNERPLCRKTGLRNNRSAFGAHYPGGFLPRGFGGSCESAWTGFPCPRGCPLGAPAAPQCLFLSVSPPEPARFSRDAEPVRGFPPLPARRMTMPAAVPAGLGAV